MKNGWTFNHRKLFNNYSIILYFFIVILNSITISWSENSSTFHLANSAEETIAPIISGSGSGELLLNVTIKKSLSVYEGFYSLDLDKINMPPIASTAVNVTPFNPDEAHGYAYNIQSIYIPNNPNEFIVKAYRVKNLNIALRKYPYFWFNYTRNKQYIGTFDEYRVWVTSQIQADENGLAKTASNLISPGTYQAKVFGDAKDNVTAIDITLTIIKKLIINGKFCLIINTTGFPNGDYFINANALNGSFQMDQLAFNN